MRQVAQKTEGLGIFGDYLQIAAIIEHFHLEDNREDQYYGALSPAMHDTPDRNHCAALRLFQTSRGKEGKNRFLGNGARGGVRASTNP
jgi:hypothetical protein